MPSSDWEVIEVTCWNYLKGSLGGINHKVSITKERFCDSDCESVWCPLHKSKKSNGGK